MLFYRKKIEKILQNKSGQDAIMDIDNLLTTIFYKDPHKLSEPEKNIVFIEMLEREVNNGGFDQFFDNSSGDHTQEIRNALKLIGSKRFLDIFEQAIAVFPDGNAPKDWDKRHEVLEPILDDAWPVWEKLDKEFCKYEEDIYTLMIDYIKKNIKDFR